MQDKHWIDNFHILFNRDRLKEFWPCANMSFNEKINAISRFIIYSSIIIAIYYKKRQIIYFGVALLFLTTLFKEGDRENFMDNINNKDDCRKPSFNNPFMNVPVYDYDQKPIYDKACSPSAEIKQQSSDDFLKGLYLDVNDPFSRNNAERQFFTTANTSVPNDREVWAEWCWGKDKVCKDGDQEVCTGFENAGPGGSPSGGGVAST